MSEENKATGTVQGRRGSAISMPPWLASLLLLAALLAGWEGYVRLAEVNWFILPPPSVALLEWVEMMTTPKLWFHTWITVLETLLGFAFAVVIGVSFGAMMGKMRRVEQTLHPFVVATQVIPKIALVPLFIVWFGFGLTPKVVIAAVLAFFPILVNTTLGFKSVYRGHREVLLSLNASRWQTITQLELPSALPYILTGMEMGIVLAIIGAVVGEFLGGSEGLGVLAVQRMNAFDTTALFAIIIHLSVVGFVFYALLVGCRRFLIPWHESVQINQKK
ncbi:MAG: ABC transporter permease [Rhodovibrionaceae bacterium]